MFAGNRHVRVERVILKDHREIPVFGGRLVDALVIDPNLAVRHVFQARDHAQDRALAAAGGTDEHGEFSVGDVEIDAVHDLHVTVTLAHSLERKRCHFAPA